MASFSFVLTRTRLCIAQMEEGVLYQVFRLRSERSVFSQHVEVPVKLNEAGVKKPIIVCQFAGMVIVHRAESTG